MSLASVNEFFPPLLPQRDYLLAVDSDGTVMDSMERKHSRCFVPAFIESFNLQPRAHEAREAWEFVNLRSRSRGLNRFPALLASLELLQSHPGLGSDPHSLPQLSDLRTWIAEERRLSNPSLKSHLAHRPSAELEAVLAWSESVNLRIRELSVSSPFYGAQDALLEASGEADIVVISQTVSEDLKREWKANGLEALPRCLVGQEAGSKRDSLERAIASGYQTERVIMVGDTFQDYDAAAALGVAFYPIIPGFEGFSWQRFQSHALPRFLAGAFDRAYQADLLSAFQEGLPLRPTWSPACAARAKTSLEQSAPELRVAVGW